MLKVNHPICILMVADKTNTRDTPSPIKWVHTFASLINPTYKHIISCDHEHNLRASRRDGVNKPMQMCCDRSRHDNIKMGTDNNWLKFAPIPLPSLYGLFSGITPPPPQLTPPQFIHLSAHIYYILRPYTTS